MYDLPYELNWSWANAMKNPGVNDGKKLRCASQNALWCKGWSDYEIYWTPIDAKIADDNKTVIRVT